MAQNLHSWKEKEGRKNSKNSLPPRGWGDMTRQGSRGKQNLTKTNGKKNCILLDFLMMIILTD